jgi:2-C-methyl-D-erythritol 4-phosphate cytidylyltransferase/2-C-methyl-D-erythritol 2,4-cyclodiphosphate synthase
MNIAIIVGAGIGKRMGNGVNKILRLLDDKPVIYYSIKAYHDCDFIDKIIILTGKDNIHQIEKLKQDNNFSKIDLILEGGEKRQDSVNNGLLNLHGCKADDIIVIHNAVNPFVTKKTIASVINSARKYEAAAAAIKARDTIKEADEKGFVEKTLERKKLWQMQTPQAIRFGTAVRAFKKAYEEEFYGTDDVSLVERMGKKVKIVESNPENIKLTWPIDLTIARNLTRNARIGFGQDSHRFVKDESDDKDKPLVLGGVLIENEKGLEANSDGDVILHALFNALSQSIGGRSLGHYADKMVENGIKDSKEYLKESVKLVTDRGYKVNNIGIMFEAKKPNISDYEEKIKDTITSLCNIDKSDIGITATSGEDLSAWGQGLGIQCFAVVTVVKK